VSVLGNIPAGNIGVQQGVPEARKTAGVAAPGFSKVLLDKLNAASGVRFSKHAAMRLEQRNITLSPEDIGKIRETVDKASNKGLKESLFVMQDVSLLVNIENRTIVTAMTNNDTKDGFVTNIDSVALL
jgi:flagellar operon protein